MLVATSLSTVVVRFHAPKELKYRCGVHTPGDIKGNAMHRKRHTFFLMSVTLITLLSTVPASAVSTPPRPKKLDAGAKEACLNVPYAISDIKTDAAKADYRRFFNDASLATVTYGIKISIQVPERLYDALITSDTNNGKITALRALSSWCGDAAEMNAARRQKHKQLTNKQLRATQDKLLNAGLRAEVLGDYDLAEAKFRQLLKINPRNKFAHYNLGYIAQTQDRDSTEAAKEYGAALKTDPEYGPALYNLAILKTANGDEAGAIVLYKRAADANPSDENTQLNLGFLLYKTGDKAGADEAFRKAIALNPAIKWRIPSDQWPSG